MCKLCDRAIVSQKTGDYPFLGRPELNKPARAPVFFYLTLRFFINTILYIAFLSSNTRLLSQESNKEAESYNSASFIIYHQQSMNYISRSTSNCSCQGNPCLFNSSINGSGLNSSTLNTPGLRHKPFINMIAPIVAGTPVV